MSPTVLRTGGFQFFCYSREEHEPPHIHVSRGGAVAKIWLDSLEVADIHGFNPNEQRRLKAIVREQRLELLEHWNEYFDEGPARDRR